MRKSLLLLLGGLLLGTAGFAVEKSTDVYWTIGDYWITLTVHDDVDLGTVPGPWEESEYIIEDTDGNEIRVRTNCLRWTLSVSREWEPPVGYSGDGLRDFYTWVVDHGGDHSVAPGWDSPNNGEGAIAKGKPGLHWFDMGYRYELDYDDIPGTYTVTLTYTVMTP